MIDPDIIAFPDEYELFDFFENFISFDNSRDFFKEKGILLATNRLFEISTYASKCIFGYDDFKKIKSITSTQQRYKKISGFIIKTNKTIDEIVTGLQNGHITRAKNKLKILNVNYHNSNEVIVVSYSYERKTPGKLRLIDAEERQGDFLINKKKGSTSRIVQFYPKKNDDFTAVRDIISSIREDDEGDPFFEIILLKLEELPITKRIQIIDAILKHNFGEWKLAEVTKIRVRKAIDKTQDSDEIVSENPSEKIDEEPGEGQLPAKELEGINDAILKGHNLRENSFVKKCEKEGFYFPKIVMRMEHTKEPYVMDLEVQFKFNPAMPEININNSFIAEKKGVKIEQVAYEFDENLKKKILNSFMQEFIEIFSKIAKIG